MKKAVFFSAILLLVIVYICCFNIFANDLDELNANTIESGWALIDNNYHRGTKNVSYSYSSSAVQSSYSTYVSGGIGLWGNNINMTYTSNPFDANLVITIPDLPSTGYTARTHNFFINTTTDHIIYCDIEINPWAFDDNTYFTYDGKIRSIAHEIGHAYGLNHVTSTSSIMFEAYSTTKNVTSQDVWGMKVVTHAHIHGTLFMGTYEVVNASYHDITCNSCHGKIRRIHAPNAFGVCACGYTGPFLYP